jgi:hypothetical protein
MRACCVAGLAFVLSGCLCPSAVRVETLAFNEKLRADRGALSAEQRALPPEALPFGRWRTAPGEIGSFLRPDDPLATALPQSDCWAMANSASAGRDAMLASWEVIGRVTPLDGDGKPVDDWFDPDDGVLDLGLCRLDDPVTRMAPVTRSGDRTAVASLDCAAVSDAGIMGGALGGAFSAGSNFPKCLSDAEIYAVRLDAQRAPTRDAFGRCAAESAAIGGPTERVAAGVDFWREPYVHPVDDPADRRVSACMRDATLVPPTTTRYRLDGGAVFGATGALGLTRELTPLVQPYADLGRITRPLLANGTSAAWAASVRADPSPAKAGVRWEENYASTLIVSELRVVRAVASVPTQAAAVIPVRDVAPPRPVRLCIEDGDSPLTPAGLRCRYTCEESSAADARLHFSLDDRFCRDFQGRPATPLLTPTYALDSAAALVAAGSGGGLRQPLRWHLEDATLGGAWIEFGLSVRGGTASMRSGLSVADAGRVRVGESRRSTFVVENVGAQPLRVRTVELMASSAHAQDFRVELPFDPQPVPLGVGIDTEGGAAELGTGEGIADPGQWLRTSEGPSWSRVRMASDATLQIAGVGLRRVGHLMWRDVATFPPGWIEALEPRAETAVLMQSWRPRPLPFVMSTREGFLVSVLASPRAIGDRSARLRIVADPLTGGDPVSIEVPLRVRGLSGPLPMFLPTRLAISAPARDQRIVRNVLLSNDGDVATTVTAPTLTGPGGVGLGALAGRLRLITPDGATGTLGSGASRLARVEFLGTCGGVGSVQSHAAELRWPASGTLAVLPIEVSTRCAP